MIKRITGLVLAGVMALGIVSVAGANFAPVGIAEAAQASQKITYKARYTPFRSKPIILSLPVQ